MEYNHPCVSSFPAHAFLTISRGLQDALPTPFGLVRSGVAPDHPDTKNVVNNFTQLMHNNPERVHFMGNVRIGSEALSLKELRSYYNAVILAYGAESDRKLGIPGESLPGVLSAREFVWWYNGHPTMASTTSQNRIATDLSRARNVAIVGLGNVALDCARILLKPPSSLQCTDIASHALDRLRTSSITQVHLIGRRGPAQAAFTPKELREVLHLENVSIHIHPQGCLQLSPECQTEVKQQRMKRRVVEVLSKRLAVERDKAIEEEKMPPTDGKRSSKEVSKDSKELHFHFLSSPVEIVPSKDRNEDDGAGGIDCIRVERMRLEGPPGKRKATGTKAFDEIPVDMVLESVGYRSVSIEGVPFDDETGIIPNVLGQVMTPANAVGADDASAERRASEDDDAVDQKVLPDPGLFVCGWLKRGPTGIIGTNLVDAEQTVDTVVRSLDTLPSIQQSRRGREGVLQLMRERGIKVVDFDGWERLDEEERKRGQLVGKPREKVVDIEEMLRYAT